MRLLKTILTSSILLAFPIALNAEDHKHNEETKSHCEKTKDGKTVHVEGVSTRKECKKKGGRWVKPHKEKFDEKGHEHKKSGEDHHGH